MQPINRWKSHPALVAALAAVLMAACSQKTAPTSEPAAVSAVQTGHAIYEMRCATCHDATDLALLKQPPKLTGLFSRKTLPSGAPATDEQVKATIVQGRGIMPPIGSSLDKEQLDDLLKYLHTI